MSQLTTQNLLLLLLPSAGHAWSCIGPQLTSQLTTQNLLLLLLPDAGHACTLR
jgi:hypothetical protein